MPSMTVLDIITSSLRTINAIGTGETLEASQAADGMEALNLMLAGLAAEELTMVALTQEVFTMIPGKVSYTMGPLGDFDTVRPERIDGWFVRDAGGEDYPMTDIIGEDAYRQIPNKSNPGRPDYLYVSYGYPLATFYFYPVNDTAESLYIDSFKPMGEYTNLTTVISLPPQYLNMIKWNLAIACAPEYPGATALPSFPTVVALAEDSKTKLLALNAANRLEAIRLNLFPPTTGTVFLADIRNG